MTVSICCLAYNHAQYIAQALDGFLLQKANFDIEIIIGEDHSTDETLKVVESYQEKYPGKITVLANAANIGMMPNFIRTLSACKGEYIALCEGDDYWTDENKLQLQVDFLEKNKDHVICFHDAYILTGKEMGSDAATEERYNLIGHEPVTVNDLLRTGNFMHTPTVVFRNVSTTFPFEMNFSPVGDYFLYVVLAQHGFIKRLPGKMAVYRKGVGLYSTQTALTMGKNMLAYEACILSYLESEDQKKIFLARHLEHLKHYTNNIQKQLANTNVRSKGRMVKKIQRAWSLIKKKGN